MAVPRDVRATLRGLRFHWLDWGTAGHPPMLLLHGGAQTAHSWDEVAPALARRRHVVALDQRGHGKTDWAPRYRRADFVDDVAALLDHLGQECVTLVGLSLGGLNAIAFAAAHPGRVRGLIVVDVVPTVVRSGTDAIRSQLAQREFDAFEDAVALAHRFNPRRTLDNIRERLHHGMRELPDGRWTYRFDPGIGADAEPDALERLWADVRRLRCPTLLVRGAESPVLDDHGVERFRRECARAAVAEVPGAGHSVMGDNPAGFVAAVTPFLRRHGL